MILSKNTPCTLFEIRSPIWGGGKKSVGLALNRITKHNEINFTYRRKSDGELSIPDHFYFDGDKLGEIDYEHQNVKGLTLVIVPFSDLERLEREKYITEIRDPEQMPPKIKGMFFNDNDNMGIHKSHNR